jgi:heptosyltransferase-2/heptosyltransferase-3
VLPGGSSIEADDEAPVVVRFPALGDTVLLTALLEALHERYQRRVHVLASGAWVKPLLGAHPAVGQLRTVRSRRMPYWSMPSQWQAVHWLRRQRGPVYLCDPDEHALRLVQRAVPADRLLKAWDHWPGNEVHWVDWWLQVAQLDPPGLRGPVRDLSSVPARPSLHLDPASAQESAQWLAARGLVPGRFVLVQPGHKKTHKRGRIGTGGHNKHWPAERWAAVISGILASDSALKVLVCGSDREHGLVQEIVEQAGAGERAVNGARELPLQRLMGVASSAHSMVSVDTGPAHIAAAMDCPLVVLFGLFGWARWVPRAPSATVLPLGPRAQSLDRSVMDISVDEVLAAWRSLPPRASFAR